MHEFIYERDSGWHAKADVMIADISTASTGVGVEVERSLWLKKKLLCLYDQRYKDRVSPMFLGNKEILSLGYESPADACQIMDGFLNSGLFIKNFDLPILFVLRLGVFRIIGVPLFVVIFVHLHTSM